jgi:hypothetical protein
MKKPVSRSSTKGGLVKEPTLRESASYIRDLLQSLENIAHGIGQPNLAHFISAAASEAAELVKQG